MTEVDIHDLEACGDVFDWLAEASDSMDAQTAITMLEGALAVQAKLKVAIDLLRSQALKTIEQPILIGSVAYAKKPSFKMRPDQQLLARVVTELAAHPDENGELPTASVAAATATNMMKALYVSPSTVPKVGGVKALGLEMDMVCREEHTGFELRRTEIE